MLLDLASGLLISDEHIVTAARADMEQQRRLEETNLWLILHHESNLSIPEDALVALVDVELREHDELGTCRKSSWACT